MEEFFRQTLGDDILGISKRSIELSSTTSQGKTYKDIGHQLYDLMPNNKPLLSYIDFKNLITNLKKTSGKEALNHLKTFFNRCILPMV